MRKLLSFSFSKIYIIVMILISLLVVGGYFSYAMFTVSKERSNAISIVTGNLTYKLTIDGTEGNSLTVPSNTVKDFKIILSNPNNRIARFNFYYLGDLPSNTKIGYIKEDGTNTLPGEDGINLEKIDTAGSSNTYTIRVINNSGNNITINLGVSVGLDYNDLSLPENGHLFEEIITTGEIGTVALSNISKDNIYNDGEDTFTTGETPNNYLWYSGKLWRVVSVNNEEKTVKLVTQWNISAIPYNPNNQPNFEGSYMEEWLNDTSVDGFLRNLREPEKFIVMDAKWNATLTTSTSKPSETTMVTDAVGLLNIYEYTMSYRGTTYESGYLNNGLYWLTLTPVDASKIRSILYSGSINSANPSSAGDVRPSINLKSNAKVIDGNGTVDNPYKLEGDNDKDLNGVKLNTRYSGEYIRFGIGENNLYRIVSHETPGLTKITSADPIKESEIFITKALGAVNYSTNTTMGSFLNGEYLTKYVGDNYANMIEDSTTWYLGTLGNGASYKLAKYTDESGNTLTSNITNAKIGLLRYGELMAGQFAKYGNNTNYWTLTLYNESSVRSAGDGGGTNVYIPTVEYGVQPALNLKENVIITGGLGTKEQPFELKINN